MEVVFKTLILYKKYIIMFEWKILYNKLKGKWTRLCHFICIKSGGEKKYEAISSVHDQNRCQGRQMAGKNRKRIG